VKSAIAGLAGALVATLGVAAWQARTAAPALSASMSPGVTGSTLALPVSSTLSSLPTPIGPPMAVRCAPGQQAAVRQVPVDGVITTIAECGGATGVVPVGDVVSSPAPDLVTWERPRVVRTSYVSEDRAPRRRVVVRERRRNWAKTAMVIGGSAGAGAGIGGIAGGKKGALIGAAIGGGAASLWEALKK
jgi:hypothetical protein